MDRETLDWAAEILGSPVRSVRPLVGGMDSAIHVLEPERGDPVVLRGSPQAAREANVLRALESTRVPAPALIAVDATGDHCGTPSLLMELMPGRRKVPCDPRTLAAELARAMAMIHEVSLIDGTLVHNDFAPHNTLFVGDGLSAVVDWTWAAAGQPAADVCFCRINVALVLGPDAGDLVLEAYEAETGTPVPNRPWWDLVAATRVEPDLHYWTRSANYFGPPELTTETVVERFRQFVEAAEQGI